jgi:very-short-patch-repair endonuclease
MDKPPRNTTREATERARRLRREMGWSEKRLWQALRGKGIGFRFRRQHPVGPYTLDFYCFEARLCLEVDGEVHAQKAESDARRDDLLASFGIKTLRIPSLDLWDERGVLSAKWHRAIQAECEARSGRKAFEGS